jgi:hypothetical protein
MASPFQGPDVYSSPMGVANDLPEEEIAEFLARSKFVDEDLEWSREDPHSAVLWVATTLKDESGVTIPGYVMDISYRRGKYKHECKYLFTIFKREPKRTRLYQIEVVPWDKKSAVMNGKSHYGPHQHFGRRHADLNDYKHLDCSKFEEWFRVFLKLANIGFSGKYNPPIIIEDFFK